MEYFEIRMQKEQSYLHDKLDRLDGFTQSFRFHKLDEDEKRHLIKKRNNMIWEEYLLMNKMRLMKIPVLN